jgi:hypothetical protein
MIRTIVNVDSVRGGAGAAFAVSGQLSVHPTPFTFVVLPFNGRLEPLLLSVNSLTSAPSSWKLPFGRQSFPISTTNVLASWHRADINSTIATLQGEIEAVANVSGIPVALKIDNLQLDPLIRCIPLTGALPDNTYSFSSFLNLFVAAALLDNLPLYQQGLKQSTFETVLTSMLEAAYIPANLMVGGKFTVWPWCRRLVVDSFWEQNAFYNLTQNRLTISQFYHPATLMRELMTVSASLSMEYVLYHYDGLFIEIPYPEYIALINHTLDSIPSTDVPYFDLDLLLQPPTDPYASPTYLQVLRKMVQIVGGLPDLPRAQYRRDGQVYSLNVGAMLATLPAFLQNQTAAPVWHLLMEPFADNNFIQSFTLEIAPRMSGWSIGNIPGLPPSMLQLVTEHVELLISPLPLRHDFNMVYNYTVLPPLGRSIAPCSAQCSLLCRGRVELCLQIGFRQAATNGCITNVFRDLLRGRSRCNRPYWQQHHNCVRVCRTITSFYAGMFLVANIAS